MPVELACVSLPDMTGYSRQLLRYFSPRPYDVLMYILRYTRLAQIRFEQCGGFASKHMSTYIMYVCIYICIAEYL